MHSLGAYATQCLISDYGLAHFLGTEEETVRLRYKAQAADAYADYVWKVGLEAAIL